MPSPELLDRLLEHQALARAPRQELAWLVEHGDFRPFAVGDVTTRRGEPEEWLRIVLSGRLAIHLDRGAGSRRVVEWRGGDVCGLMPYSRGGAPPGDTVVEEPTDTLGIHRDHMAALIRECPTVTATLVHAMLDRARHITSSESHDEKLVSLGRLAAGLAHELNNPASAAARSGLGLAPVLEEAESAARALAAARLADAQLAAIDRLRQACLSGPLPRAQSPLERGDREDAIGAWLEAHAVAQDPAPALAETHVTVAALDVLARDVAGGPLEAVLRWVAAGCSLRTLAADVRTATSRISELVAAVRGFTAVDRAPGAEAVDIRPGIRDTVTVLGAKARAKSADVVLDLAGDLPGVQGSGAELNQVWANLIDNALDAVAASGHVAITARSERGRVVVEVVDDGPGIPRQDQRRVFDPFYTTKGVGQGSGLGLDIVRRLVQRHGGEIDLESRPGRTAFRVSLPVLL